MHQASKTVMRTSFGGSMFWRTHQ